MPSLSLQKVSNKKISNSTGLDNQINYFTMRLSTLPIFECIWMGCITYNIIVQIQTQIKKQHTNENFSFCILFNDTHWSNKSYSRKRGTHAKNNSNKGSQRVMPYVSFILPSAYAQATENHSRSAILCQLFDIC